MGTSNTITEQEKLNAEFQKYIESQTAVLTGMTTKAKGEIQATIDGYYKAGNWKDAAPLIAGNYMHLSTVSEWNLDNVQKMIDAIRSSIFGAPAPKGSTKADVPASLATNIM